MALILKIRTIYEKEYISKKKTFRVTSQDFSFIDYEIFPELRNIYHTLDFQRRLIETNINENFTKERQTEI